MICMGESVKEKAKLDRISKIFPCVIWWDFTTCEGNSLDFEKSKELSKRNPDEIGFFQRSKDYNSLIKAIDEVKTDFEIVESFYNFKNKPYLLPPQKEFENISINGSYNWKKQDNAISDEKGLYLFFNKFYTEDKFEANLKSVLNLTNPLEDDGNWFPISDKYFELSNPVPAGWICYYNNDKGRFDWDDIDWLNYFYNPSNPWEAFQHFCQYHYTLLRIGYESDSSHQNLNKLEYKNKGLKTLYDSLNSNRYSSYEIFIGNVHIGIEMKKSKKNVFYIKNQNETEQEIKTAIKHKLYQKQNLFTFTPSNKETINRIYEKYPSLTLNKYSKKDFSCRYEELLKTILPFIKRQLKELEDDKAAVKELKKDKTSIEKLQAKIALKNTDSMYDDDKDGKSYDKSDQKAYSDYLQSQWSNYQQN